jgi:predicted DNA-binding protein (MmcQ/YjbR family)
MYAGTRWRQPALGWVFCGHQLVHADHPRRVHVPADPLPKLRALCLTFPQAMEKLAWGEPTFRAGAGKIFAMYASANTHHGAGRPAAWIKATPTNQSLVLASDADRYFKPPYVGPGGWIGVWLDKRPPWSAVQDLLEDGYRQVAAPKLLAVLNGTPDTHRPKRNG